MNGRSLQTRLHQLWENVRSSFWFVPSIMALAAVALSVATTWADKSTLGQQIARSASWLWYGGAEGARSLLSTVASSMITVTGTVFSITIASLTLATSQFGPRLLRNFTRDTGNRIVLGTFVGTFLYCLLVLRTVRGPDEGGFVPYVSVTCGVLLAVASVGVLIYFIHHVANSIQAESLTAAVAAELKNDIARLCSPAQDGAGNADGDEDVPVPSGTPVAVAAVKSGYVQTLNRDGLLEAAERNDLVIQVLRRPGDFALEGDPLLQIWGSDPELHENVREELCSNFGIGHQRTPTQDVRYGVRQLVEVATRALSPGINDPFTAMGCADWLAEALAEVAERGTPSGARRDADGRLRLLEEPVSFAELARLSFETYEVYGAASQIVVRHVTTILHQLACRVQHPEHCAALLLEAERLAAAARRS